MACCVSSCRLTEAWFFFTEMISESMIRLTMRMDHAIICLCINFISALQVQQSAKAFCWKGNQVRVLSDPVTVFREQNAIIHCMSAHMRRSVARWSVSQETCLLCTGWSFRVKFSIYIVRYGMPAMSISLSREPWARFMHRLNGRVKYLRRTVYCLYRTVFLRKWMVAGFPLDSRWIAGVFPQSLYHTRDLPVCFFI